MISEAEVSINICSNGSTYRLIHKLRGKTKIVPKWSTCGRCKFQSGCVMAVEHLKAGGGEEKKTLKCDSQYMLVAERSRQLLNVFICLQLCVTTS